MTRLRCAGVVALVLHASLARAQELPARPISLANGHVTLGGDVSWSLAPEDTGFFNFTDYDHSTLRMIRLALAASVQAGEHIALLAEVRSENGERPEAYGLYVRIRPWIGRRLDVQIGRVPPTFGAFPRRTYPADNPLIGYPLAYQYLTSIRSDALPASVDELFRMRGRGWLSNFSIGDLSPEHGVPLASGFRWDTGVQVHAASDVIEGTASLTTGTLSNPRLDDDNGGPQIAGRVVLRPSAAWIVGASGSRGPFLSRGALRAVLPDASAGTFSQTAWGADVEYSRDYYLLRGEVVRSAWTLPLLGLTDNALPLSATASMVEARYKIRPGWYAAARIDHLGFNEVSTDARRQTWEAPVFRWEVGGGYSIQRNLLLKLEYQHNTRDGGRVTELSLAAVQVVFWF